MIRALVSLSLFAWFSSAQLAHAQEALPECQCSETAGEALYTPVADAKVEGPNADGKCYQLHYKQDCIEAEEGDPPMCTPARRFTPVGQKIRVMSLNGMWEAREDKKTVKREVPCPKPAKAQKTQQVPQQ